MKKILTLTTLSLLALSTSAMAGHHTEEDFLSKDTNNDGVVSKAEYLKSSEDKFNKIDQDGDGSITKEERKAAMKGWKQKKKDKMKKRYKKHQERKESSLNQ